MGTSCTEFCVHSNVESLKPVIARFARKLRDTVGKGLEGGASIYASDSSTFAVYLRCYFESFGSLCHFLLTLLTFGPNSSVNLCFL